jgi:hypothetical protein
MNGRKWTHLLGALGALALVAAAPQPGCDVQVFWDTPDSGTTVASGAVMELRGQALDRRAVPSSGITEMQLVLDGDSLIAVNHRSERADAFRFAWDTLGVPLGAHTLTLEMRSACGWAEAVRQVTLTPSTAMTDARFNLPFGVTIDGDGNPYVTDRGNNRVQKLSASGDPLAIWGQHGTGFGQFDWPRGIALDVQGNIYVVEEGNHRLHKLSATGEPLAMWGGRGATPANSTGLRG